MEKKITNISKSISLLCYYKNYQNRTAIITLYRENYKKLRKNVKICKDFAFVD